VAAQVVDVPWRSGLGEQATTPPLPGSATALRVIIKALKLMFKSQSALGMPIT